MYWLSLFLQGLPFAMLLYILIDEYLLFAQRKKIAQDKLLNHLRLYRVSQFRLLERFVLSAFLVLLYFFRSYHLVDKIYLGAYIGFVTNALVTVLILHVFIPKLKEAIAESAKDSISDLIKMEEEGNTVPNVAAASLAILGFFVPGGLVTTAIGGLLSLFAREKVKSAIEEKKKQEFEKAKKQIEEGINNMSKSEVCNMMDEMIGKILILIELAGFVTGGIFGLLVSYL